MRHSQTVEVSVRETESWFSESRSKQLVTPDPFWKGRRVLVTGATGFLGSHLIPRLLSDGATVAIILRPTSNTLRLKDQVCHLVQHFADLEDLASIGRVIEDIDPEIVFHLAALSLHSSLGALADTIRVNSIGTLNLLEALKGRHISRFVYAGSCFEYGEGSALNEEAPFRPTTVYGVSKAAADLLVQTYGRLHRMPVVALRLFTPYGPREHQDRLIPYTILSALLGKDILLTRGEQERDFVYVQDVIEAIVSAAICECAIGTAINICSGHGTLVKDVVLKILSIMHNRVQVLTGTLDYRPGEVSRISGDPTRAQEVLGWSAQTGLEEGLKETISWHKANLSLAQQLRS